MSASQISDSGPVSAAFFCPQAWAPDEEYLNGIRSFLNRNQYGQLLLREIADLKNSRIWSLFATASTDVASLSPGPEYLDMLHNWAAKGVSGPVAAARSGVVALPLLVILQVSQYLSYLEHHKLSHRTFLAQVGAGGGLQGFCGGLATAIIIACAADETQVVQYTATAMRVLVGVGAYSEAADDTKGRGSTTLALRLKYDGQGEDITQCFPGTYVSAITEPRSISVVGPAGTLHELSVYAQEQEQLKVQKMDIRGKTHNPENQELAEALCTVCDGASYLHLPDASKLHVPVRSNRTGRKLTEGSLIKELVTTILAYRCEWYTILTEAAQDIKASGHDAPKVVTFGLTDAVSVAPFVKEGLRLAKVAAHPLISRVAEDPLADALEFPETAIAVIGASCRLPGANNLDELWELLASGADQHRPLGTDRFDIYNSFRGSQSKNFDGNESRFFGNFIDDIRRFDNSFFGVNPREAASMDPQQRILLEVAYEALDDAGYLARHRREDGDNVGCFIGGSLVEYLDNTSAHAPTAYVASGTIRAFLCGRLSYYFGWSGPAEVIDTACSSSLVAINRACKAIQADECPMALCGGVNIITGMNNYFDLGKAGFLSPTGQCKPFDISADGYCRAEGVGLVVLKKLSRALADGDAVMGVIPGISTNQGGLSSSITIPHSAAQQALYKNVLQQARIPPENVSYIEAHGTGTQAGDPLEVESLRSVFGKNELPTSSDRTLYIGSIKGNLGHCETAAGVAGLLKVLAMIKNAQLPSQASHGTLNPKIAPLEPDRLAINRCLRDWDAPFRAALVNSYGAAGSNCALLCCEMPSKDGNPVIDVNARLPLLISAASEKSLLRNAQALSAHLRKHGSKTNLGDLAYTLNERRKRHKFLATIEAVDVQDVAGRLENLQADSIVKNTSESPRPVVLVFSGQFDTKVKLDKAFYDKVPAFRHHLDLCDRELTAQGFPSILPSVFDSEPAADATLLQCGIFAMQYASAQCWIDAGLKPNAVIGHSLGELTALAVCGVLSLAHAIKLVASRARLIDTHWGPDKGSMLALSNCSASDSEALRSQLQQKSGAVFNIACYNAADTIVACGASADMAQLEGLVSSEPRFQKIRSRPLSTSHGFHSHLTEPLLADLAAISESLEWKEPKFPLEMCSNRPIESFKHYDPSRHLREPVFFVDAVQRLEQRFSSMLWLEAGISTPAVAMARAASGQANVHSFLSLKASGTLNALDSLAGVVSTLWRNGHFLRHWRLVSPERKTPDFKPIWLPPYQFERTQHWVPNIDRVLEMRQTVAKEAAESMALVKAPYTPPSAPPTLVNSTPRLSMKHSGQVEFTINVHSQRYSQIVRGHSLRSRALCPASMYMESVIMALQLLAAEGNSTYVAPDGANLVWEEVNFQSPLGTEPNGEVVVRLSLARRENAWNFAICTLPGDGSSSRPARETRHVSGVVSLAERLHLDVWERLVSGSMERIVGTDENERLMSKRTYGLFSRLVNYPPFFQGIYSLVLHDREAVATIRMPEGQPAREESTAWSLCDTVTIDAFIQVLGFIINTSDFIGEGEVAVMVGLDRAVISRKCDFGAGCSSQENWRVYARFEIDGNGQPIGDIFVWNTPNSDLVAVLTGCRFSKVPIVKLERSLDQAMRLVAPTPTKPAAVVHLLPAESSSTSSSGSDSDAESRESAPTPSSVSSTGASSDDQLEELQKLLAEGTGVDKSEMTKDMLLADMGLDSLAAVDLAGELSSKFKLSIASHELQNMTVEELSTKIGGSASVTAAPRPRPAIAPPRADDVGNAAQLASPPDWGRFQKLKQVLVDVVGVGVEGIEPGFVLADLGIDSMSANDLRQELQERFSMRVHQIKVDDTVEDLMKQLSISISPATSLSAANWASVPQTKGVADTPSGAERHASVAGATVLLGNPFEALRASDAYFDDSAKKQGYFDHSKVAAPYEDEILLAHITEGFAKLGVNLSRAEPGSKLPQVPHLKPKYDRLVPRLWEILQHHGLVTINPDGTFTRTDREVDGRSSATLLEAFRSRFPAYKYESDIIGLTGPRLADCLSGELDSVNLLFGSPAALKIMANFYDLSPMMSTLTDQLVHFLKTLLRNVDKSRPIRILEVGAGTGGTTRRVLAALASANISTIYTFTDIAASLVSKAKAALKEYDFIEYGTFNLEKEVPEDYRGRFDVVISTNCVHATTNRTNSCRRLRDTLAPGGIVVLSELTRKIDWYDTCFGLLDGWWLAEGRTIYPIQPADRWMSVYEAAGYASYGYSWGPTLEATSQQLLVACNERWTVPAVQEAPAQRP